MSATGDERDPFQVFDASTGSGVVRDPYPKFAELRRESPMLKGSFNERFGVNLPDMGYTMASEKYIALSYEAVSKVLLDGETFTSSGYANSVGLVFGHSILEMDDPEHHRHRALLQQAFGIREMQRWEERLVGPIVNQCIDAFAKRGRADLVRELAFPFPIKVIAGMLGLPEADLPQFHRWAVELISIAADPMKGFAASQTLKEYFAGILAQRRADPQDDFISLLAGAKVGDDTLDDDAIFAFLRLLLPAGAETTYRSSSNLLFGLLTHPEQLDAVRADRALMRPAMEEGLRWECPLTSIQRSVARDVEVCGVHVPEGAAVSVCLGAANRDDARWDRPDEFDVFREPKQHMAFAYGPHTCLGMHLARMETRVALNALFDRLPNLRLDPEAEDVHITGLGFRAPRALPVVFDPS